MNAQFPAPADGTAVPQRPVVLIGPMAAGKSFLALHMSKFYGYDFVDADQVIVSRYGVISGIFAEHGEKYFRDLEADTIAEILRDPDHANAIFSVGGGAPMTPSTRELLRHELVAYLEVDAETVLPRISGNRTRPMLQPDPERRWQELYESRRACYEELADITLDGTRNRPVAEIGADLEAELVRLRSARAAGGTTDSTQEVQA
ncbi:shikimate kinase [Kocuria rosea subsp. polaris]|uniref:Shikimate kinase n=1 Tax=Kocuria rosea subsp. polaris TaxID=136273 RepID=A0A0W8IQ02_KOCRO|nr:shikimate kinase [Kocuria polaris]KUG61868.1 shikimate kinase [Kocuria polaris]